MMATKGAPVFEETLVERMQDKAEFVNEVNAAG